MDGYIACVGGLIRVGLKSVVIEGFAAKGEETMQTLTNFFGGLRTSVLSPLMVGALAFAVISGMVGQVAAQTPRYTIDDVMDKLIEMDRNFEVRLGKLETRVDNLEGQISDVRTTVWALFGFLGLGLFGMVGFLFSVSNRMGRIVEGMRGVERRVGHLETILLGDAAKKPTGSAEDERETGNGGDVSSSVT